MRLHCVTSLFKKSHFWWQLMNFSFICFFICQITDSCLKSTMSTQNPSFLWVKWGDDLTVDVPIENCPHVSRLIDNIKMRLAPDLDSIRVGRISLHLNESSEPLPSNLTISGLLQQYQLIRYENPLILKVAPRKFIYFIDMFFNDNIYWRTIIKTLHSALRLLLNHYQL